MKTIHIKVFAVLALMLALSSCNIYRPYKTPEMNTDDLYRTDVPADSANMALRPWQELFTDQNLRNLIDSALVNNFDYQTAMYMVEEANAAFAQGKAAFFPTLNISADGTLSKVEDVPHGEYYNIAAAASWELDIFGRLRSAKRAAKAAPEGRKQPATGGGANADVEYRAAFFAGEVRMLRSVAVETREVAEVEARDFPVRGERAEIAVDRPEADVGHFAPYSVVNFRGRGMAESSRPHRIENQPALPGAALAVFWRRMVFHSPYPAAFRNMKSRK